MTRGDPNESYPRPPVDSSGRTLDAHLHLLDRLVLDVNKTPVMVVDDLELAGVVLDEPIDDSAPAPTISALLSGATLGTRLFGGRPPISRFRRT